MGGLSPAGPVAFVTQPVWENLVVVLHRNGSAAPGYTDSGVSMYMNGAFVAEDSTTAFDGVATSSASDLQISSYRGSGLEAFTGSISDVAIFNTALTPTQISSLYNAAVTGSVPEPTLLAITALPAMLLLRRSSRR